MVFNMKRLNLKQKTLRLVLTQFLIFLLFIIGIFEFYENRRMDYIKTKESSTLNIFASQTDNKIDILSRNVEILANDLVEYVELNKLNMDEALAEHHDLIQTYLNGRVIFHEIFNGNIILFSSDGKIIRESPGNIEARRGKDLSFRKYFKDTILSKKPQISDIYISTGLKKPALMFTAPVMENGKLKAVLGARIDLMDDNAFKDLISSFDESNGYLLGFIITNRNGRIVLCQDEDRIMEQMPDIFLPFLDNARQNGNSFVKMRLFDDDNFIFIRTLNNTDWFILTLIPEKVALSSLFLIKKVTLWGTIIFTVLFLLSMIIGLNRFFKPLLELTSHIEKLKDKDITDYQPVAISADNEFGTLKDILNLLINNMHYQTSRLKLLSTAVDENAASVVITDRYGNIEYVNNAFCHTTGYSIDELVGKHTRLLKSGETSEKIYQNLWESISNGKSHVCEFINKRKSGEEYYELNYISPIIDKDGTITHYVASKADVSEKKELEQELKKRADFDTLTGLATRHLLYNRIDDAIDYSSKHDTFFALLFIDLDHFKEINDDYGHDAGDIVLKTIAERMTKIFRQTDVISRLGGDEFVVLVNFLNDKENLKYLVEKLVENLVENVKKPIDIDNKTLFVSASIGISIYPKDGVTPEDLVNKADKAMYNVKNSTRGGYLFYSTKE